MPSLASGLLLAGHGISAFRLQRPSLASSISAVCSTKPSAKDLKLFNDLSKHILADVEERFKYLEESLERVPNIFIEQLKVTKGHLLEIIAGLTKCTVDVAVLKTFKKDILGGLVRLKVMAGKRLLEYVNYSLMTESVLFPLNEIKKGHVDLAYFYYRLPDETEYEMFQEHIRILSTFLLDKSVKCSWGQIFFTPSNGHYILHELKRHIDAFRCHPIVMSGTLNCSVG